MTARVQRLLSKAKQRQGSFWMRRLWWGESLRASSAQPPAVRLALALDNLLRNMPVEIQPEELIVGLHPLADLPEDPPETVTLMPDQDPYRTPEERAALDGGVFSSANKRDHLTPNFARLLAEGVDGVLHRAEAYRDHETAPQRVERRAIAIALRGASLFMERYAHLAEEKADHETDPVRRKELGAIASTCRRVAHKPARTLREAVQLTWFAYLIECLENGEGTGQFALGRFDQYLWPYWKADRDAGFARDDLAELVACFWVKLNEFTGLQILNLTIGGSDQDGEDAVNELSYVCLELITEFRSLVPSLSVRWHPKIDSAFFRRTVELSTKGFGQPAIYNDTAAIKAMVNAGVDPADATDVVPGGCVELGIQGCCHPWVGNFFNLPKCLELALHDGIDPETGQRLGHATGSPAAFGTYEELLDAYDRQVSFFLELMAQSDNTTDSLAGQHGQAPFLSSIIDDCIDRGMDMSQGGARYNFTEVQGIGIAHVVDSLLNVKRLVYQSGVMTLEDLVAGLDSDFEGEETLRGRLMGMKPAYGDHSPETSAMARTIAHRFFDRCERSRNPRGGTFRPGLLVWTLYDDWADRVGALPDGRRRGEAMVSSIGPRSEARIETATSIIQDVTSFDHYRSAGGLTLNLRFDADLPRTQDGIDAIMSLIRIYFDRGGMQLQINVVDSKVLQDAQENPGNHAGLLVRVSGFCARFADISRRTQDEVIARAELRTN
jgi:trans-4-hydroxy-L-proline dehydratase